MKKSLFCAIICFSVFLIFSVKTDAEEFIKTCDHRGQVYFKAPVVQKRETVSDPAQSVANGKITVAENYYLPDYGVLVINFSEAKKVIKRWSNLMVYNFKYHKDVDEYFWTEVQDNIVDTEKLPPGLYGFIAKNNQPTEGFYLIGFDLEGEFDNPSHYLFSWTTVSEKEVMRIGFGFEINAPAESLFFLSELGPMNKFFLSEIVRVIELSAEYKDYYFWGVVCPGTNGFLNRFLDKDKALIENPVFDHIKPFVLVMAKK